MSSQPPIDPAVGAVAYLDAALKPFVRWLHRAVERATDREAGLNGTRLIALEPDEHGSARNPTFTFRFAGRHAQVAAQVAFRVRLATLRAGGARRSRLECDILTHDPTAGPLVALLLDDLAAAWPDTLFLPQAPPARDAYMVQLRPPPRPGTGAIRPDERLDWLRAHGRRAALDLAAFGLGPDTPADVVRVLHELSDKDRDFLHLWRDRSLTADDIGQLLGLVKSTVYNKSIKLRDRFPVPWGDIIVPHRHGPASATATLPPELDLR